ncbi:unnamed protein product [Menidia menidia]|uniref:(Atlantic silverside) hypothetical protein n=1 Tax=Menidia menidia TaxID=238744 RepID=A0A8S4AQ22_9TELE|nr:unnamed protein product [Menidia menidia]
MENNFSTDSQRGKNKSPNADGCFTRKGAPNKKGKQEADYSTFGTNTITRKKKAVVTLRHSDVARKRPLIGKPLDFRPVSSIIDVDILPESHRRVRLYRHGSDKPLGFYIRDGTSVRVTPHGLEKVPGIFISRLVPGGLAESTGLLAVNDEVLEVNGIEVTGKSLDQVTDMMIANSHNLIVTVKPVNQRNNVVRSSRISGSSGQSSDSGGSTGYPTLPLASAREIHSGAHAYHDDLESDEDTDIVIESSLKRPSQRSNASLASGVSGASRSHQQAPMTAPSPPTPPSPPTRPLSVVSNASIYSQTSLNGGSYHHHQHQHSGLSQQLHRDLNLKHGLPPPARPPPHAAPAPQQQPGPPPQQRQPAQNPQLPENGPAAQPRAPQGRGGGGRHRHHPIILKKRQKLKPPRD